MLDFKARICLLDQGTKGRCIRLCWVTTTPGRGTLCWKMQSWGKCCSRWKTTWCRYSAWKNWPRTESRINATVHRLFTRFYLWLLSFNNLISSYFRLIWCINVSIHIHIFRHTLKRRRKKTGLTPVRSCFVFMPVRSWPTAFACSGED